MPLLHPTHPMRMQDLVKNPLWFYLKLHWRDFVVGMLFLILTNVLDVISPLLIKRGIDQIASKAPLAELSVTGMWFFLVMGGLAVGRYGWRIFFNRYHTYAAEDLRVRLFKHFTDLGPNFYQKNQVGELISLAVNDIQAFRQAIGSAVLILADAFLLIALIVPMMLWLSPEWTWKTLIFVPLLPLAMRWLSDRLFVAFKKQQDELSQVAGFSNEIVNGIRVIKSFALEPLRLKLYDQLSRRYELATNKTMRLDALFTPIMEMVVAPGTVILLLVSADDISAGALTIGSVVAFQRYLAKITWPISAIGYGMSQYKKGMASFARISEVLISQTDTPDQGTMELQKVESLEVRNLTFTYPGNTAASLCNISFKLEKGESLGIVGPVGSGKTTLAQILTRLYPCARGSVLINGRPIEDYTLESLRQNIVLIPQDPYLFSETVLENLKWGAPDITTTEAVAWAKIVDIDKEIELLPHQYLSPLGEKGVNLSGGQKQRLALARGLLLQPPLLILDDNLSAVDLTTEKKIIQHLSQLKQRGQSFIVISHRLSVLSIVEKVLVLKDGRLERLGRSTDLLLTSPTFAKMAQLQEQR
jgi:ATP-binding cassette subfamily B multidrug efflux pump